MNPLSIISSLLGFGTTVATTISGITAAISNQHIALINATTEQDKNVILGNIAQLQAQQAVLVADSQRSNFDIYVRSALGVSVLAIIVKLLIWDKVIGSLMGCVGKAGEAASCLIFNTDKLSDHDWWLIVTVVGFYTISTVFKK